MDAAERALVISQRCESPRALCLAYRALHWAGGEGDDTDARYVSEAMRWARESGDPTLISRAYGVRSNYYEISGRLREHADSLGEGLRFDLDHGLLSRAVLNSGMLAWTLVDQGRFDEAAHVVRDGLGLVGHSEAVYVRVAAGTLAVRRGDLDTASLHFARAREQSPTLETQMGIEASPALAEHLIALDRAEAALELVDRCLPVQGHDPFLADLLLLWAARACAHLAQIGRDHGNAEHVSLMQRRLMELVAHRETAAPWEEAGSSGVHLPHVAREALLRAETERVHGRASPDAWGAAADRAREAELGWEAAVADYRHAEALAASGAPRSTLAAPLRDGYRFATRQAAVPLARDIEALALSTRVSLMEPRDRDVVGHLPNRLTPLTPREREILGHLVAGRTYAEIAAALFISEKTVSVHVSNLLRKTGTSSSREVVALAIRLGAVWPG